MGVQQKYAAYLPKQNPVQSKGAEQADEPQKGRQAAASRQMRARRGA
jgi:hypothetical protein